MSTILNKHLTEQGQMWPKYLPLATLAHNTFNSPNLANYSPYKLTLQQLKSKCLAMINNNCKDYQYNSGDLVYIISHLTSQLRTNTRKVTIKYVGPLVIYKIVDPHNYLLMTLDVKIWSI